MTRGGCHVSEDAVARGHATTRCAWGSIIRFVDESDGWTRKRAVVNDGGVLGGRAAFERVRCVPPTQGPSQSRSRLLCDRVRACPPTSDCNAPLCAVRARGQARRCRRCGSVGAPTRARGSRGTSKRRSCTGCAGMCTSCTLGGTRAEWRESCFIQAAESAQDVAPAAAESR